MLRRAILDTGRERNRSRNASVEPANLERNHFYAGRLITAEDLALEQLYVREKLRRHNRLLHGWGIVSGLEVESSSGCEVTISKGYAIDAHGEEIVVPEAAHLDVCKSGAVAEGETGYLAVRAVEHAVSPAPTPEGGTEPQRTREAHELAVLTELPETSEQESSPPADSGWVVLAELAVHDGQVSVETGAHRRYVVPC
jgi:hypothetical protein